MPLSSLSAILLQSPVSIKEIDADALVKVLAEAQPSDRSGTVLITVLVIVLAVSLACNFIFIKALIQNKKEQTINVDTTKIEVALNTMTERMDGIKNIMANGFDNLKEIFKLTQKQ